MTAIILLFVLLSLFSRAGTISIHYGVFGVTVCDTYEIHDWRFGIEYWIAIRVQVSLGSISRTCSVGPWRSKWRMGITLFLYYYMIAGAGRYRSIS
jgi:hypothetical protein